MARWGGRALDEGSWADVRQWTLGAEPLREDGRTAGPARRRAEGAFNQRSHDDHDARRRHQAEGRERLARRLNRRGIRLVSRTSRPVNVMRMLMFVPSQLQNPPSNLTQSPLR